MKILQLGKFYPIRGGVEKVMRDLTEGLSEKGIHCDMLCAKLPSLPVDKKDSGLTAQTQEATIIRLNPFGSIICVPAKRKIAGTMIAPAMIRYLKEHGNEYDILHIHHPDPMAALALRLSGYNGRVILHWHSDILSQRVLLQAYKPLQRWLIQRADTIVGTTPVYIHSSPYLKDVQDKCTYVPIGVSPISYDARHSKLLKQSFNCKYLLLSVGRLVPYKGYRYLLDAMKLLPEEFTLILIGDGPLRKSLEKQMMNSGLQDRVIMGGYLEECNLFNDLFGACDVFVLPSIMKTEAFGIVQIEAMSCGTPVVATRIPGSGVSWVNQEGLSGMNAIPKDPRSLADAILKVCGKLDGFGKGAYMLYNERYTKNNMISKMVSIYEN